MIRTFPLFLTLEGRGALVVGGGEAAARKVEPLLAAGARVSLIAGTVIGEIAQLIADGRVSWAGGSFEEADLAGMALAIVATDDEQLQTRVSAAAQARSVPVNVVDTPALSSFIMPSIVDRSPITIAISTGGTAPALARKLKAEIERALPAAIGRVARFAEMFREQARRTLVDPGKRRRFWDRVLQGRVGELALAGDEIAARRELIRLLDGVRNQPAEGPGMVHLVGAGPGDPDLLTLKAHRLLQRADVVVYDRLVSSEVLALARRDAERIYVGKRRAHHCMAQSEINQRLVALARAGKSVVRLKGGDPLVFGRGAEEALTLARAGVPFRIVPGITAGIGGLSYAGIPVTHRDTNHAVTFLTGHGADGKLPKLDWNALAKASPTLVIYMGRKFAGEIAAQLIAAGRDANEPAALVSNASGIDQDVQVTTLGALGDAATQESAPTIIVIGENVKLRAGMDWLGALEGRALEPWPLGKEDVSQAG
jgi:uroporphyrin-III C-methyltransferase/precorrin-2 dehydrogenase/sirohydrochlorin ferrochelatase